MAVPKRHDFFDFPVPLPFAHRGGNEHYPENTLAAFRHAYNLGYRYFETDVHYTVDEELVAFHDKGLFRTLGISGQVADMTKHDRHSRLLDGKHRVPLLAELLEAFPDAYFNIDTKSPTAIQPLIETVKAYGATDRVCLASFVARDLRQLRKLLPGVPTIANHFEIARLRLGLPIRQQTARFLEVPTHIFYEHRKVRLVTRTMVDRLHAQGRKIFVWTVNNEAEMRHQLDIGVDGIFTDKLTLLKEVLESRDQWINPSELKD